MHTEHTRPRHADPQGIAKRRHAPKTRGSTAGTSSRRPAWLTCGLAPHFRAEWMAFGRERLHIQWGLCGQRSLWVRGADGSARVQRYFRLTCLS